MEPCREVTYDEATNSYRVRHDWDGDTPLGVSIVSGVAAAAGVDELDVEPLNGIVDPDALEKLFRPRHSGQPRKQGKVTFVMENQSVTVFSEGEIIIQS